MTDNTECVVKTMKKLHKARTLKKMQSSENIMMNNEIVRK